MGILARPNLPDIPLKRTKKVRLGIYIKSRQVVGRIKGLNWFSAGKNILCLQVCVKVQEIYSIQKINGLSPDRMRNLDIGSPVGRRGYLGSSQFGNFQSGAVSMLKSGSQLELTFVSVLTFCLDVVKSHLGPRQCHKISSLTKNLVSGLILVIILQMFHYLWV